MRYTASLRTHRPPPSAPEVHARLLAWWDADHRALPWRGTRDPYAVLVSEVMLQQTQAPRVAPIFVAFMTRFPTLDALAAAPVADVIRAWSGLGYNRRAVNLHRLARVVMQEWDGVLPQTVEALLALPGIGGYTARAVASLAFGVAAAAVDTNIRRVLSRLVDGPESNRTATEMQRLADSMLHPARPGDWNESLMELGALLCLPVPRCDRCPLESICRSAGAGSRIREQRAAYRLESSKPVERFEHSARFYRGRIVHVLRADAEPHGITAAELGLRLRLDYTAAEFAWLDALLVGLERDGLVARRGDYIGLPADDRPTSDATAWRDDDRPDDSER